MTARVAGVILAAGQASRLGAAKQLLPIGGRPLLAHALDAARRAGLAPIVLVLGHEADAIIRHVDHAGTEVVRNPDYAQGQSTSVRAGVAALPPDVDAVIFLLGDQPGVDPDVLRRLVAARAEERASIAQPRYAEGPGNPVLFGREWFPALLALTGDAGARPLLAAHRAAVRRVDARDRHRPEDIDTWEDYERVRRALEPSGEPG